VITAGLGFEAAFAAGAGFTGGGYPIAALRVLTFEATAIGGVVPLVLPLAID
jgi:hypothetical protein